MRRMPVRRLTAAACLGAIALTIGVAGAPQQTLASWAPKSMASSPLFSAGVVNPPGVVTCTDQLLGVRYSWPAAAAGGLTAPTVTYDWSIVGTPSSGSTTLTFVDVALGLGVGTYTFSVVQRGPGGWSSTAQTHRYRILVVLGRC